MIQSTSKDTDWKMVGWGVGILIGGILVGAMFLGPVVQKIKDKKKKSEAPAKP